VIYVFAKHLTTLSVIRTEKNNQNKFNNESERILKEAVDFIIYDNQLSELLRCSRDPNSALPEKKSNSLLL